MSTLNTQLEDIEAQIDALRQKARALIAAAPHEPVDHDELTKWYRRDRYIIVRPDGQVYGGVPGIRAVQVSFSQRPAAVRAAKYLPGARLYDTRERVFVNLNED
jgi:hypothetical protein